MSRKEPVGHTCPIIDSVINEFSEIEICSHQISQVLNPIQTMTDNEEVDFTVLQNALDFIASKLEDIRAYAQNNAKGANCPMEELRSANACLRDWGKELAVELDNAEDQISLLEDRISDLENEVSSKEGEIAELQSELNSVSA